MSELLLQDAPERKGKHVATLSYHDANLYHSVVMGISDTGVHFLNKTPVNWHSKKQATFEIATCGYENSSAQTHVE